MASERLCKNYIAMLVDEMGNEVSDHQAMDGLLWSSFKDRMGKSDGISMQFNLSLMI
jgi:hypothetical protein